MTFEEATEVYRRCDPRKDSCNTCPLNKKLERAVAGLGFISIPLCDLYLTLLDELEGVKSE